MYYWNSTTEESTWDPPAGEDFSRYNQANNTWHRVSSIPVSEAIAAAATVIQGAGVAAAERSSVEPQQQSIAAPATLPSLSMPNSAASSPRGGAGTSQRNSHDFGMEDNISDESPSATSTTNTTQQFVPTTAVEDDPLAGENIVPPPPPLSAVLTTSSTVMEAWRSLFEALKASGAKIQTRQLAQCGHVNVLAKAFDELEDNYVQILEDIRSSVDNAK